MPTAIRTTTTTTTTRHAPPLFDSTTTGRHLSASSTDMSLSWEITGAHKRESSSSSSSCLSDLDLESGTAVLELKKMQNLGTNSNSSSNSTIGRDCRICHLGFDISTVQENGFAVGLGCSCKGDLAFAHKKCAETWFKIKGNMICEICGATATNVAGEQTIDAQIAIAESSTAPAAPVVVVETRTFWHSRRVMNLLLACLVLAFVISWLFHFKVLT